jgi:hypothetical protein
MPSYQNLFPPISLAPGDVEFSFNNEAFPGSAQAGSQFAICSFAGQPDTGTAVRWQTSMRNIRPWIRRPLLVGKRDR